MRILFTGGSSFTGMWFALALAQAGHKVTAIFQSAPSAYEGIRKKRVEFVLQECTGIFECSFGSSSFFNLVESQPWDLLCHHAADVTQYRSASFDFAAALSKNTYHVWQVLQALKRQGCAHVALSGSIFEQGEGVCNSQGRAISPYGLSKGLTSTVFSHFCSVESLSFGKFVIPNPFGPYEEDRFTSSLAYGWLRGKRGEVKSPSYIRDNIPVSLLAKAYAHFIETFAAQDGDGKLSPSFRPETQKAFAQRFALEMAKRLQVECPLEFFTQQHFVEPCIRINRDLISAEELEWDESTFWDDTAAFYAEMHAAHSIFSM